MGFLANLFEFITSFDGNSYIESAKEWDEGIYLLIVKTENYNQELLNNSRYMYNILFMQSVPRCGVPHLRSCQLSEPHLYEYPLFWIIILGLGLILGLIFSYRARKEKVREQRNMSNNDIIVHSIHYAPVRDTLCSEQYCTPINSWLANKNMKDLYNEARQHYSNFEGAKKGVITTIKLGSDVKFFLYIRLNDGSIIKQPINLCFSKADSFPQDLQQLLSDEKEIVINEFS